MTDNPKRACLRSALSALTLCAFGFVNAQTEPAQAPANVPPAGADPVSAESLAFDYYLGTSAAQDIPASVPYFEHAAAQGLGVSQYTLGQILWFGQGGVPADSARALELTRLAAEQGIALAQSFLGWAYMSGNGVGEDPEEARKWLTAAAKQQDGYATFLLALLLSSGDGAQEDYPSLSAMMVRAAELGHQSARLMAGRTLLLGGQELQEPLKGMHLLELASQGENGEMAAFSIGEAYLFGEGVARDYGSAARWMQQAFDGGYTGATLWLAEMNFTGRGIDRDEARAQELLLLAVAELSPQDLNSFAWLISVSPNEGIRDGTFAVHVMDAMLVDPQNRTPAYLDTLAAAHAEAGDFELALQSQNEAIALLDTVDASDAAREDFRHRLELYQSGESYRVGE